MASASAPGSAPVHTAAGSPVLALDIGGTKLAVGLVFPDGRLDRYLVAPSRRDEGPERVIARLFDLGREAHGDTSIAGVGISCGGPLDARAGVLLSPPHLPGWIDVPIVEMAREAFGVPAFLENDATAAVLGEHRFGVARGADTVVYLTVSTGVGGGTIVNGRVHRGAAGNGGELGHIMVRPGGRLCTCGRHGCLEAYCSGTQIARRGEEAVIRALTEGRSTSLPTGTLTGESVSSAAAEGDPVAREVWDETVGLLGQAATDLVNVFEPDYLVLGGGVTKAGALLLDPLRAAVKRAMPPAAAAVRVEFAGLGQAVGVVGAGVVALDGLSEPRLVGARA